MSSSGGESPPSALTEPDVRREVEGAKWRTDLEISVRPMIRDQSGRNSRPRVIAFITDERVARRILDHLGIPAVMRARPGPFGTDLRGKSPRPDPGALWAADPCIDPAPAD